MEYEVIDSKTRLEVLRYISEIGNPVGADTLAERLQERGVHLTVDAVRYHLRVLDRQGFTRRVSNRGRLLTPKGWKELDRSMVDSRLQWALARHETLAQQVTFDAHTGKGQVIGSLVIFSADELSTILRNAARACRAGLCVSDRVALLEGGERFGYTVVPSDKKALLFVSGTTIDGILLSRGLLCRISFGGIVEVSGWHPHRIIDVVDYGRGSLDPTEILIRSGRTKVRSVLEQGNGLILADVGEMIGVARERTLRVLEEMRGHGLGGVVAIGQVGQPILGVPVQRHAFGIAEMVGANPFVALHEEGLPLEFAVNESLVEYSSLRPISDLLPASERERVVVAGALVPHDNGAPLEGNSRRPD